MSGQLETDLPPELQQTHDIHQLDSSPGQVCCDVPWEEAYLRFETPEEERRKFFRRLCWFGAKQWDKNSRIVELFCGQGNGLIALERLGFKNLSGVDLSGSLLSQYQGPAPCFVADCRELPFEDHSQDILVVQGGLHHLLQLPDDLEAVLREAQRVLRPQGIFVVVEPWLTPFLALVHFVCRRRLARNWIPRIDALATMIEHERETYDQWLSRPNMILEQFRNHFELEKVCQAWGKLQLVGKNTKL